MRGEMQLPCLSEVGMAAAVGRGSRTLFRAGLGAGEPAVVWHWAPSPGTAWKSRTVVGRPFCGTL